MTALAQDGDLITGGHIPFPIVRARLQRRLKIITLLREPAARSASEYDYAREGHWRRNLLSRPDSSLMAKKAAALSFEGFLDFQLEHATAYGDPAARLLGWGGREDLRGYFDRHVFHAGVLERSEAFTSELAQKLGKSLAMRHENRTAKRCVLQVDARARTKLEKLPQRISNSTNLFVQGCRRSWARCHKVAAIEAILEALAWRRRMVRNRLFIFGLDLNEHFCCPDAVTSLRAFRR